MSVFYISAAGLCFWSAWLCRYSSFAAFTVLMFLGVLHIAWAGV